VKASPQSEQVKTRKLPIENLQRSLVSNKGDQPLDKQTQERIKETVKLINKRIFIPLQNQGANDFKSQRRHWETSLEQGVNLEEQSVKVWYNQIESIRDSRYFEKMSAEEQDSHI